MRAVFRYPIAFEHEQDIEIQRNAELLTIERQTRAPHGLSLWALVDPDAPGVRRRIMLVGTGHTEVTEGARWIATCQEADGFVWHFFDMGES